MVWGRDFVLFCLKNCFTDIYWMCLSPLMYVFSVTYERCCLYVDWFLCCIFCTNIWTSLYLYFQFSSVAQSCLALCDPMNPSMPGLPVHHQLPEFTQTHVHWVGDAIQPSHPLSSSSPPAPNPSQHQNLFQWVNSSHEVAKVLEFQL